MDNIDIDLDDLGQSEAQTKQVVEPEPYEVPEK